MGVQDLLSKMKKGKSTIESQQSQKEERPMSPAEIRKPITVLKDVPREMLDQFKEDAKENLEHVKDPFYRVSITGARFKVNGALIGDKGTEFQAIILREIPVNIWYSTKYDPNVPTGPDCWSLGGLSPDISSPMVQSESCVTCPRNRFGSGIGQDGKRRGKACRNMRRLVLKVDSIDIPVVIPLPPTSTKSMNFYLKNLTCGEIPIPMFGVVTTFAFDPTVEYPKPIVSQGRFLTSEEYAAVKAYRMTPQVEDALNAYATPEDYEEETPDGTDI